MTGIARWWRLKSFVELVWRSRSRNLLVWVTTIRDVRRGERAYLRDLERVPFCGPDYDR